MRDQIKGLLLGIGVLIVAGFSLVFYQTLQQTVLTNPLEVVPAPVEVASSTPALPSLLIGTSTILKLEVATSSEVRERGLSGRADLPADTGLLFIFPETALYGFWMKEMNFAIDIIWLAPDGKVVEITKEAKPESYPNAFYPPEPVKYVLEVNAGYAEQHNLKIGDILATLP